MIRRLTCIFVVRILHIRISHDFAQTQYFAVNSIRIVSIGDEIIRIFHFDMPCLQISLLGINLKCKFKLLTHISRVCMYLHFLPIYSERISASQFYQTLI